jgi:chromosome segregation ATPase
MLTEKLEKAQMSIKELQDKMTTRDKEVEDIQTKMIKRDKDHDDLKMEHDAVKLKADRVDDELHKSMTEVKEKQDTLKDQMDLVEAGAANAAGIIINDAKKEFDEVRTGMMGIQETIQGLAAGARVELDGIMKELTNAKMEFDNMQSKVEVTFIEEKR